MLALGTILLGEEEEVEDPGHQDGLQSYVVGGGLAEREAVSSDTPFLGSVSWQKKQNVISVEKVSELAMLLAPVEDFRFH